MFSFDYSRLIMSSYWWFFYIYSMTSQEFQHWTFCKFTVSWKRESARCLWIHINSMREAIVSADRWLVWLVSEYPDSVSTTWRTQYLTSRMITNIKSACISLLKASQTCDKETFLDGFGIQLLLHTSQFSVISRQILPKLHCGAALRLNKSIVSV